MCLPDVCVTFSLPRLEPLTKVFYSSAGPDIGSEGVIGAAKVQLLVLVRCALIWWYLASFVGPFWNLYKDT